MLTVVLKVVMVGYELIGKFDSPAFMGQKVGRNRGIWLMLPKPASDDDLVTFAERKEPAIKAFVMYHAQA